MGEGGLLDGGGVTGLGAEVKQQLGDAGLAVGTLALGVDDPDLAKVDGRRESGTFGVAGDELDVLDAAALQVGCVSITASAVLEGNSHWEW